MKGIMRYIIFSDINCKKFWKTISIKKIECKHIKNINSEYNL